MLRNYFKTALRNLFKNKGYSAINILGLACGLAICLLIILFVTNELSYDKYNKNFERIYRVDGDIHFGGHHFVLAATPDPLGAALKANFPQVEQYVRFRDHGGMLVKKGTENIPENRVILTDSTLFDVFTLPMIEGNPHTALTQPKSVVITRSIADKYFGTSHVIGKTLTVNDTSSFKITGVIRDMPEASHFHYDFFVSMYGQLQPFEINQWTSNNFNTYVLLKKNADAKKLSGVLDDFIMKQIEPIFSGLNMTREEFEKQGNQFKYSLMPLKDIHLYSNKTAELEANGSISYVYIFSVIALFILLIACVNFMNLSTARSAGRAREVGVRKVLGSKRSQLIGQFLTESLIVAFISMLLALVIAYLMLPYFNKMSGKNLSAVAFFSPAFLPGLIGIVLIVGVLAGIYPAFFLSSFKPITTLKGKVAAGFKTGWLRSSLVVFQFAISIFLIVGTIVVYSQLKFINNKDIGYNRNNVLVLKNTEALGNNAKAFREQVLKLSGVQDATMTGYLPTNAWRNDSPMFPSPVFNTKEAVTTQIWKVDENYIPTLGMKILKGRNFSDEFKTDSNAVIMNQAAAKLFNFSDPVGKDIYYNTDFDNPGKSFVKYHIIGVLQDFNFNSLRENVTPLVFLLSNQAPYLIGSIAIRIHTDHPERVIASVEKIYKSIAPGQPFDYSFMDADFDRTYKAEQRIGSISFVFSILAILVACLGLFGLISYAAEQRTKEIGIRKVLGASVSNISTMLSKDFLKLVLIAALVSFPLAWWAMNKWLQGFAYRTKIEWWFFVIAGIVALLIALLTVSFQAIKAAIANPVKSLRSE